MIVGLSTWKVAKVGALASVGYVIKTAQDAIAAAQTNSVDWTAIILALIAFFGVMFSGIMSYLALARVKAVEGISKEIKHDVNSTASSLKTAADKETAESKRKDDKILALTVAEATIAAERDALKLAYAAAQERLVSMAVQVPPAERVPAAAPTPTSDGEPLPVKVVAAVPVPVRESPEAKPSASPNAEPIP